MKFFMDSANLDAIRFGVAPGLLDGLTTTLPAKVFEQIVRHPLTDVGLERFLADAKKTPR